MSATFSVAFLFYGMTIKPISACMGMTENKKSPEGALICVE